MVSSYPKERSMAEIHIFSGLGTFIFPPLQLATKALEDLIDQLPGNHDASHHTHLGAKKVWKKIVKKRDQGTLNGPICLIGHSQGVRACARVADHLDDEDIQVDYIGAIDPTLANFPPFQNNVQKVEEFWATKEFVAEGRRLSGFTSGVCTFGHGWPGNHQLEEIDTGHIECASDNTVRTKIVQSVKSLLPT